MKVVFKNSIGIIFNELKLNFRILWFLGKTYWPLCQFGELFYLISLIIGACTPYLLACQLILTVKHLDHLVWLNFDKNENNIKYEFVDVFLYDVQNSGLLSALPYLMMSVMTPISGIFADYLRQKSILSTTQVFFSHIN